MTREEREKALYALRKSTPIMAMTPNEFDDYIKTLNKIADWLEQEPCEDAISRQAVLNGLASIAKAKAKSDAQKSLMGRIMFFTEHLSTVTPKQTDVLDKIRTEIEQKARPNEIGGRGSGKSIRYGLCMALEIIDKYKAESEERDGNRKIYN